MSTRMKSEQPFPGGNLGNWMLVASILSKEDKMDDLIYADFKAEKIVEKKYPNIKIEDASDEIHLERFGIQFN